ncbi:Smr/MutS family protein [Wolbachia endosymbiont of Chironomus riparius]|uniref:Smr/MutS family protein n=1 Tax=Wolbachia endosymbiont of Chironomus riparius TaxID=2883238 RepID=UPI00209FF26A|nr:Smr/MutS family protein [Wolbachia endosymbiont of Chironomus riparius]
MLDDESDWQKNIKPIRCNKAIQNDEHKINLRSVIQNEKYDNFITQKFDCISSSCLDYNTKLKIDRGKYHISDRLDLHSYTIDNAYYKLIDFVIQNYQRGNRCLLVITGYGSTQNNTETIKSNLYKWLSNIKIQHMILYYRQAKKIDGGEGAFYVLLRRNKNLKI